MGRHPKTEVLLVVLSISLVFGLSAYGGYQDFLKDAAKALEGGQGLSEAEIAKGLKEALQIGTGNAVAVVSKVDGYYKNPDLKILLPESIRKVEGVLRATGFGGEVDQFELSMNRAAERAAPEAKAIFVDSIRQMTFSDARRILNGPDNAATMYFKEKTGQQLAATFKPIVHQAMSEVGVTRSYQQLTDKLQALPFGQSHGLDLDQYVTDGGLNGLFRMLAEEEKKIRQDPAARVTDLLQKVFGKAN